MDSGMLSLQNISVVKCAILTSLSPELRLEVLCVPGSEYDSYKLKYQYYRKEQWNEIVERKAKEILNHIELKESLQEKVISILPAIALRMLIWAEYHEGTLGLTRDYSLNFLNNSHFTSQGLIDNKKAAKEMIKDVNLSIKQKYKLACIYCFTSHIFTFFKQMDEDKKNLNFAPDSKWMEKHEISKYWTFHLTGRVDEENKNAPRYFYRLEKAIKSGSKEAVKYSLEKTRSPLSRENALIYGVTEVLDKISEKSDWIVFRDKRFDDSKESWVPNYFYVDILCFLLSHMTGVQKKKALEKHIKDCGAYVNIIKLTVLELFLCWPYQDYFMNTAVLLWDAIPTKIYADILYEICKTIEPCKMMNLLYGEEKSYDYKKLLKDFWRKSPDRFKRFVFANRIERFGDGKEVAIKPLSIGLVFSLISFKTFTSEDEEIISLILGSATFEEKTNLTSAELWRDHSTSVLKIERFEIFDRLLLVLCKSEEEIREFKKKLDLFYVGLAACYSFLKYSKINTIKSLIDWMSLSECDLLYFKKDLIYSNHGMQYCRKLLLARRYNDFEECIKWFLQSKEKTIEYKRELTLHLNRNSTADRFPDYDFSETDIRGFITRFTRSKLSNREAIQGIQTSVADIFGRTICEDLIAGSSFQVIYDEKNCSIQVKNEITGGQWERIDMFLRWSLSTEKKILEFKKSIFKVSGVGIHFQLIKAKQWKEAIRFFDWLGLSAVEIKDLKKRTLFYHHPCWKMFHYLVFEHDEMNNLETIDLFLRWSLTDKKTAIEFRDNFLIAHENHNESEQKKFNTLIENYLDDLDQEERCGIWENAEERFLRYLDGASSKRTTTVLTPQKKIRLLSAVEELHDGNTGNCSRRRSQRLLNKTKRI